MTDSLPQEKLAEVWKGVVDQAGPFQRVERADRSEIPPHHQVTLDARFARAPVTVTVFYDDRARVAGLYFQPVIPASAWSPPPYADPARFEERQVSVESGAWKLPGTLTLPRGAGPFPALVLIQGSGQHDRDAAFGPNRPFKDLAWGLAGRGIATLRYDKRSLVDLPRMYREGGITVRQEVTDDALGAVALLRRTAKIDPARIFVLGHDRGGTLLPRIGASDRGIAGFVSLAGPLTPMEDLMLEQVERSVRADGKVTPAEQRTVDDFRRQVAKVKDPALTPATPEAELPYALPATYWLDLRGYRPAETARGLQRPLLVLQGGRDVQVPPRELGLWQAALQGSPQAAFRSYPDLNHLFIPGEGPENAKEYQRLGHLDPRVVEDVARFVLAPRPAAASVH
jgi:fermentation-respiration switch protein FrsA (DUF1100 family)